jgi:beta-glucosidase
MVLLKNQNVLPLKSGVRLAVLGPLADSYDALVGNYNGTPTRYVTALEGLKARGGVVASGADVAIVCVGLTANEEGEKNDREKIELPDDQIALLRAVHATGVKTVAVVFGGSSIAFPADFADAILDVWYPGEEGGNALADVLYGNYTPSGRLPVTFYRSTADLPDFNSYDIQDGHTYRYFKGTPLYPFGFGLSYTRFQYSGLQLANGRLAPGDSLNFSFNLKNGGARSGDEVVEVYLSGPVGHKPVPKWALKSFTKVKLSAGEATDVRMSLSKEQLEMVLENGNRQILPGRYRVWIGGHQPGGADDRDILNAEFMIGTDAIASAPALTN